MPNRPRLPAMVLGLCVSLVLLAPTTILAQEDPPPTPADPALAAAWSKVEAARAQFTAADRKYQDAQNAARATPSSDAKAAAKAAKKERDRAEKEVKGAESSWRKQVAAYGKRRPASVSMPVEPPTEVVPADHRAPPGGKPMEMTPTPTAIPLGSDVLLPTPGREVPAAPTVTPVEQRPPAAPATSPFQGTYTGEWVNNTFGSRGPASAVISIDTSARTFQVVLTLGGQVFGVGAPPPQTFIGSYDTSGRTINTRSDLLGNLSISISPSGAISGTAKGLPNPNIAQVDFSGTATPQSIRVNYTVAFSSGGPSAQGVMTLIR